MIFNNLLVNYDMANKNTQSEHRILTLIDDERERLGTIQKVADLLGVRKQTISSWLTIKTKPDTDMLLKIASENKNIAARELARKCLNLRYPKVFPNGTTKD